MATETQTTQPAETKAPIPQASAEEEQLSTVLANAPALSQRGLTRLLILMCIVPIVTVLALHFSMPPVKPGYLKAELGLVNVPPTTYYNETALEDRIDFPTAELVVKNTGEEAWTHLNIRINSGHYQIYEHGSPLEPGEERKFLLNRFVHRSGAVLMWG